MKRQTVLVASAACGVVLACGAWLVLKGRASAVRDVQARSIGYKDAREHDDVSSFTPRNGKPRDFSESDFARAESLLRTETTTHKFTVILGLGFAKTLDEKRRVLALVTPYASDPEQSLAIFQVLQKFKSGDSRSLVQSAANSGGGELAQMAKRALAGEATPSENEKGA